MSKKTKEIRYANNGNITFNPYLQSNETYNPATPMLYGEDTPNQAPNALTNINYTGASPYPLTPQEITYTHFNSVQAITENKYTINFTYNSNHDRKKMVVVNPDGTQLTKYYLGSSEKQVTAEGTRWVDYIGVNGIVAMHVKHPGNVEEIVQCHTDRLGSPIVLINSAGTKLAEYSYDPWGKLRNPATLAIYAPYSQTWQNQTVSWFHRGYTGHEMLFGVNLINMNGRMYDPLTCQFLSTDNYIQAPGFSQSFNRYAYCFNNPLVYTDPSGENPLLIVIGVALWGAYIGGATANNTFNPFKWDYEASKTWVGIGIGAAIGAGGGYLCAYQGFTAVLGISTQYAAVGLKVTAGVGYFAGGAMAGSIVWQTCAGGSGEFKLFSKVTDSDKYPGIDVYETKWKGWGGITLPPFGIFVENGASGDLKKHEYGHFSQYNKNGALNFYTNVGLPSLYNGMENKIEYDLYGELCYSVEHEYHYVETDANINAGFKSNRRYPTEPKYAQFPWYERLTFYIETLWNQ